MSSGEAGGGKESGAGRKRCQVLVCASVTGAPHFLLACAACDTEVSDLTILVGSYSVIEFCSSFTFKE